MPYDNPPLPMPTQPSPAAAGARDSYKVMCDYPATTTTGSVQYTSSDYAMLNSQVYCLPPPTYPHARPFESCPCPFCLVLGAVCQYVGKN